MVNILAIDTSVGPTSVAVCKNGHIAATLEDMGTAVQSARLLPMIEEALEKSSTSYKDLSAVACTIGPGSFTGIRIALSAARGIALATDIKGLGFTTLEVLAFAANKQSKSPVLTLLNAGKGEVYYQGFDAMKPRFEARLGTLEKAASDMHGDFSTAGNVTMIGRTPLPIAFPRADALAELAATHTSATQDLAPFYIRPPDAKQMTDIR